jgi:hypothetical protein
LVQAVGAGWTVEVAVTVMVVKGVATVVVVAVMPMQEQALE